jgi:hypothetical protein
MSDGLKKISEIIFAATGTGQTDPPDQPTVRETYAACISELNSRVAAAERCNTLSRLEIYHAYLDSILVPSDYDDWLYTGLAAQPRLGLLPKQRHHLSFSRLLMHLDVRRLFHLGSSGVVGSACAGHDKVNS